MENCSRILEKFADDFGLLDVEDEERGFLPGFGPATKFNDGDSFSCRVCKVTLWTEAAWTYHLDSPSHLSAIVADDAEDGKLSQEAAGPGVVYCAACNVHLPGWKKRGHLESAMHRQRKFLQVLD